LKLQTDHVAIVAQAAAVNHFRSEVKVAGKLYESGAITRPPVSVGDDAREAEARAQLTAVSKMPQLPHNGSRQKNL
jgi:hypothetical protein